ncbi:MAG: sodium:solute symporter family protein [candidate division KSB1 bacterium]|nr:sodium:solute symporter family protein [candidate division KSB1 bacterium]
MKLQTIDLIIIALYMIAITAIGFMMKKRAEQGEKEYLLGGNRLPWYLLGLSNASGMLDISGTMWLVTIGFIYGLKSIWIPWLWPVFNQIFLMIFLSKWLRRSGATTGAEWLRTRFGDRRDTSWSHMIVVVFALISCLGFLAYGFIGLGKFIMIFVPWDTVAGFFGFNPGIVPPQFVPHVYGVIFTLAATVYCLLGGMAGIVWADLIQYTIITLSSIVVAIIAMTKLAEVGQLNVPDGWFNPFFGWRLGLDWNNIIPQVNRVIDNDGYELFSIFMMMLLFKGILVSMAGPAPNYDMQKVLSTRNPKEAGMMSGSVSVILMPFRYLMITGFIVLGLLYFDKLNLLIGGRIDFEQILPSAMAQFIPVGFLGLLLAGLTAAFVSTFSGTLNAGQAYLVNDIFLRYINPKAKGKHIARVSQFIGLGLVIISMILGVFTQNIDSVLKWIVSGLFGSYVASNVLKWYWWRFNGYGYFWGMVGGLVPALIFAKFIPSGSQIYYFPITLAIALTSCIIATLITPPSDKEVLKDFYKKVRPWGFWKPIHEKVVAEDPSFVNDSVFSRDMINVVVGTIWQTALVAIAIYIVTLKFFAAGVCALIIAATSLFLKKNWYDKIQGDGY